MENKYGSMVKEILSMEEYIRKRKKQKEEETIGTVEKEEKSPAWMMAELYG